MKNRICPGKRCGESPMKTKKSRKIIFPLLRVPTSIGEHACKRKKHAFGKRLRLEDYGHCANSQITPGLPVENR
ncbi:hypothetical protein WN48_02227 [Eufriesea mexicana]|uniref:Uncharacterized protein n=1 Tax=Eufriesea mexicana TaxID=516756 RepID=A0A310SKJ8_9HYME|nr:hypothetical protein WN48_02227 [Eufriesea mexicana]